MATTKPIRQVTKTITPAGSNLILLDDGISMGKATLSDGVSAVAGDLIDTAIDDLDLGTAAQSDAADFATAAQGTKADSAVQPGDIGTMATETASDYTKTADLAAVATSNDYGDLSNLPTLGTGAALDAPSDPDLSNDPDKLALRGDVDANLVLQFASDDTALKGMDISIRKAIFGLSNQGWWLPTTDDVSAEITAGDPRYQPTLDDATGAGGGFVQAGSVGKGNPWVNVAGGADIIRLADRLMVGCDAVAYDGKTLGATDDTKSWLLDTHMDYLLANAAFAAVTSNYTDGSTRSSGSIAMTGAARHNGAAAGGAIGGAFAAWNDGTGSTARAWGLYAEVVKANSGNGFSHAGEFEATGLVASPLGTVGSTPYSLTVGELHGLWVSSGGGDTADTLYNADAAIGIYNGANLFSAGIVFYDTALYRDGGTSTGRGHAIRMARNHAIEQYAGAGVLGASLAFDVSDATHRQELRISDTGMTLYNADGKFMLRSVWSAASTVGIDLVTGTTAAIIRPNGSITDAGIIIRPSGSANGFLQGGAGTSQFRWNESGRAFGGNTPIPSPVYAAATGTATRTTFDTATVTLQVLAEHVKAMIDDDLAYGLYKEAA